MMARTLYDLAGADPELRFSPYCWRARLALAHKDLPVETVPWRFTDTDAIAFSGQGLVPVLVDEGTTVTDSWSIALYLEDRYPDRPSLFGGAGGVAPTRFVNAWADTVLNPGIVRLIAADIVRILHDHDKAYFRQTREARFGQPLEELCADRDSRLPAFRQTLEPLRALLGAQSWLGGAEPTYADFIVLGSFQWARCASPFELLAADDPVRAWRERLLDRCEIARDARRAA
jgi:glutathione S-transferase